MIKIFHIADLHLDSPFSGGDIRRSEAGRNRLRQVFRRMMKHIRETGYDIVLIAGDLYDCGFVTEETAEMIRSELGSLPCPVVISPGNHDPYGKGSLYSSSGFSDNVHIFKEEKPTKFDFDNIGVSVWGYAFNETVYKENPIKDIETDRRNINILCAHGEIGAPLSPYAPMTYGDIEQAGFIYAALGHIHKAPAIFRSTSCTCAYSGFAEGRAFDEIGKGSALSVSIFETGENSEVKIEPLSFSSYSFEILPVNVYLHQNDAEIAASVSLAISEKGYGKNNAVRVNLEGFLDSGYTPSLSAIARKCKDEVDYLEIKDNTLPLGDDSLLSDMTLRGEFYRIMREKIENGERGDIAATAMRIGLAALEGRDISAFMPGEKDEMGEEN